MLTISKQLALNVGAADVHFISVIVFYLGFCFNELQVISESFLTFSAPSKAIKATFGFE